MRKGSTIAMAAFNGLVATALSAIGAHALPATMAAKDKATFSLATDFHLFHALALLGIAALMGQKKHQPATTTMAIWLFQAGIIGFSGSLYLRTLLGPGSLGPFHWITPIGGVFLMGGWIALIMVGIRTNRASA